MSVKDFVLGLSGQQRAIMETLTDWLDDYPELEGRISYGVPMYYRKRSICYLNPIQDDGIEFAFVRGTQLSNYQGLLQEKNRKMVRGIDLFNAQNLPLSQLQEILNEAILIDDEIAMRRSI